MDAGGGHTGEFLLLTCHERFDYAAKALKNQASEYLLKPFDVNIMEAALKKIILKIREKRQLRAEGEYGKWAMQNQRQMKLGFWNRVLSGHLVGSGAADSIEEKRLHIDPDAEYRLVVSRIARPDEDKMNSGLMLFIMENIHSEVLCGNRIMNRCSPGSSRAVYPDHGISGTERGKCGQKVPGTAAGYREIFGTEITTCISGKRSLTELYDAGQRVLRLLAENVDTGDAVP